MQGAISRCDCKVVGSVPVLSITLCPWKRHLTLIPNRYLLWCGRLAQVFVSQWHTLEKNKNK